MFSFKLEQARGKARLGHLATPHGQAPTPLFMPCGTAGSVKGVTPEQLRAAGVRMVLANAYHLMLRPGAATVARLGGLHRMMAWDGPILTDSGGYQVFSLAHLRRVDDEGVVFRSHVDGAEIALTPVEAIAVQARLGADVIMQLDECPPGGAEKGQVAAAVRRSAEWARLAGEAWRQADCRSASGSYQALFGIQQGGVYDDLRSQSAERIVALDLPGYAIGGLSVGEGHEAMCRVLDRIDEQLPPEKPRYLMGVGEPRDILAAVARGVDMFDCVLPTRNARNAQAFTWSGRLRLRNARWAADARPLDDRCDCYVCRNFSRGALRHLFVAREMLAPTLLTVHNLHFFSELMSRIRRAIRDGNLPAKTDEWLAGIYGDDELDNGDRVRSYTP